MSTTAEPHVEIRSTVPREQGERRSRVSIWANDGQFSIAISEAVPTGSAGSRRGHLVAGADLTAADLRKLRDGINRLLSEVAV
jgi:hypothetical protein